MSDVERPLWRFKEGTPNLACTEAEGAQWAAAPLKIAVRIALASNMRGHRKGQSSGGWSSEQYWSSPKLLLLVNRQAGFHAPDAHAWMFP